MAEATDIQYHFSTSEKFLLGKKRRFLTINRYLPAGVTFDVAKALGRKQDGDAAKLTRNHADKTLIPRERYLLITVIIGTVVIYLILSLIMVWDRPERGLGLVKK